MARETEEGGLLGKHSPLIAGAGSWFSGGCGGGHWKLIFKKKVKTTSLPLSKVSVGFLSLSLSIFSAFSSRGEKKDIHFLVLAY